MKIMTLVGTRPEVIRLSRVLARLDATTGVEHLLVHTGQNWDYRLNGIFFEQMGLRAPDEVLDVDHSSLGATLGDILRESERVLLRERPDAFLVLGDTNSALSVIMARRLRIPSYHMEAGNRCFDANVPEEVNRRIVDHTADFNLVYTEHARRNLLSEGIHPRRLLLTGSPMREVIDFYRPGIVESPILTDLGLVEGGYFLASAHREENVDSPSRLAMLVDALNAVAQNWEMPVLVSTHPRTRQRLEAAGLWSHPLITFHEPVGFLEYNRLQMGAACVLSDSGTISEESALLGFPAVTLRSSIERPEALDTGSITMTDLNAADVVSGVSFVMQRSGQPEAPADYQIPNSGERVVNFILSTAGQHQSWSGLRDR